MLVCVCELMMKSGNQSEESLNSQLLADFIEVMDESGVQCNQSNARVNTIYPVAGSNTGLRLRNQLQNENFHNLL